MDICERAVFGSSEQEIVFIIKAHPRDGLTVKLHLEELIPEGVGDNLQGTWSLADSDAAEEGFLAVDHGDLAVLGASHKLSFVFAVLQFTDASIGACHKHDRLLGQLLLINLDDVRGWECVLLLSFVLPLQLLLVGFGVELPQADRAVGACRNESRVVFLPLDRLYIRVEVEGVGGRA